MCNLPRKFFQVCRLCLVSIEENDILAHRISGESRIHKKLFADCSCSFKKNKLYDNSTCRGVNSDNRSHIHSQVDELIHTTPTRVPLKLSFSPSDSSYTPNIGLECKTSNENDDKNLAKQCENNNYVIAESFTDDVIHDTFDDSSPSIVIQILSCLSLEVCMPFQKPILMFSVYKLVINMTGFTRHRSIKLARVTFTNVNGSIFNEAR